MEVDDGTSRVGNKRHFTGGAMGARIGQVCRYWQEGRCLKGVACQWQHPALPGTSGRFAVGGTKRPSNANDEVSGQSNGTSITNSFSSGSGGRGRWGGKPRSKKVAGRNYQDGKQRNRVCMFWLRGECNRGSQCSFLHSQSTASDIEMVTKLSGHELAIRGIALPAGSSLLYTGGQDKTIRVWDCDSGQCSSVVPMGGDVGALLSEGGWLFVGLPDEVKTWNMQTSAQQSLIGPKGQVHALAISNDLLIAGSQDGNILAWKFNPSSNAFEPAASLMGHTGAVITLQAAGGRLYSGSMDKSIRVWDLSNGQCLQTIYGHSNVVMSLLCWEQFLLSCSLDGFIKVWQATASGSLEVAFTFPEDSDVGDNLDGALALCGSIDANGKPVLMCSYNDNTVRLFDLPTFSDRGVLFSKEEVRALQVGPGGLMFSGDSGGDINVWCWSQASSPSQKQ
ncbi:hypothetical protein O6H91_10G100500 [Diphasiastrum complanatum]|uniref:Uncharacterized protein n=2 Tax=Diphasiastrum complanatum TaxID=34168 RepID=A0ACC2CJV8_DIPCM|nr:hypothetical protein O6H91_10G100500 [Diphasiastrum complanatum]KAJ7542307.1 hypothetical protein O6H91_10G100500 [Diphasiastrum complanatum]